MKIVLKSCVFYMKRNDSSKPPPGKQSLPLSKNQRCRVKTIHPPTSQIREDLRVYAREFFHCTMPLIRNECALRIFEEIEKCLGEGIFVENFSIEADGIYFMTECGESGKIITQIL